MYPIKLTLILITLTVSGFAQKINGNLKDTEKGDLKNASIALLKAKDSTLLQFTRSDANGAFTINKPQPGFYLLYITHPKYADFLDSVDIKDNTTNFETVNLQNKMKVLEAITVKAKVAAIRVKGDTIIYTADSFKVKDGGTVDDLFKKLPGFTVKRNGEIEANGKKVQNLLVDGEEFFGNDPGMVSKTLAASAVDKVELFEKKSDQAEFTGIDDGERATTVNLKLKANAKKGTMGKVETSGGTPSNYDLQGMLQAFRAKRKLAIFGLTGNVGNTDLGWGDKDSYGGGEGTESFSDGENSYRWSQGDEFSDFYGGSNGIPTNWNAGAHYNNKFNNDKQSINLSYRFNKVNANATGRTYSTTFLPDSSWNNNSGNDRFTSNQRNKLSFTSETKLDSSNTLKVTLSYSEKGSSSVSNSFEDAFTGIKSINGNRRINTAKSDNKSFNGTLLWMHKFKKLRRTFSVSIGANNNETNSDGNLFSENKFYKLGILQKVDTVDQLKLNDNNASSWNTRIVYTEPLSKYVTAEVSYGINQNNSDRNQNSYDKDVSGKYTVAAPLFSNNFLFNTIVHAPRVALNYTRKKTTINIGTKVAFNTFDQLNKTTNLQNKYSFQNIFPTASVRFGGKKNTNYSLNYFGSGNAPTLEQLQPIQDNSNPLYINVGNPNLKQSFSHQFNGNVSKWDMLTQSSLWSYFGFNMVQNAVTDFSTIDTLGRTISKAVNVNGNYYGNFGMYYNKKLKKLGVSFSFGPTGNISRNISFLNGLENVSNTYGVGASVGINDDKNNDAEETLWDYGINYSFTTNNSKSSINSTANAKYWLMTARVNGTLRLAKDTYIETDGNIEMRQKDPRFPQNNNYFLWNAALNRTIVKNKWIASFKVRDILNQNRGFDRTFSGYNFTESYFNILKRYYLVTITYKFNTHKAKQNAKK